VGDGVLNPLLMKALNASRWKWLRIVIRQSSLLFSNSRATTYKKKGFLFKFRYRTSHAIPPFR